jgi:ABC-type dipeptide/oligopeptide/nickel transport system permease component
MRNVVLPRLIQAVLVAVIIGALSFALVHALPGDAALRIAADRYGADALSGFAADAVRHELGLDRPWPERFAAWMGSLVTLDLGKSLVSGQPVVEELKVQLGYTLVLAAAALTMSLLIGPPLGLFAGLKPGGLADQGGVFASIALRSLPPFVIGLLLMLVFSIWLGLLPPAGFGSIRDLILPALTLALGLAAVSSRVTANSLNQVMASPHIAFARTKGLPEGAVVRRHALRNAAIPVVAYLGMQSIYLIEGLVVVESLFSWPGIGHALVHAVVSRDVTMVQGAALVMGLLFVLINFLVDAVCRVLDPRLAVTR